MTVSLLLRFEQITTQQANIYLFKVNNRNSRLEEDVKYVQS